MTHEIYSNHIGAASELLLAVDIKEGFVPYRETLTYASRLRKFLQLVSVPRARSFDGADRGLFITPIDRLRTLHMVRWTLFDDDKRLLLAVTFDHPIGPYIRRIVDEGGPLLDTILCHAQGYEKSSTDLGYSAFLKFAQDHQIEAEFFTATFPQLTTDDLSYLMGLEQLQHDHAPDDVANTTYRMRTPGQRAHDALQDTQKRPKYEQQGLRLLRSVHYASRFFPEPDKVTPDGGPDATSKDHLFYKSFARFLLEQIDFKALANPADAAAFKAMLAWYGPQPAKERPALPDRPAQRKLTTGDNVQGDIVRAYKTQSADPAKAKPMNIGAMLFLRFENSATGGAFLEQLQARITSHGKARDTDIRMNIALSHRGLKTLNTPDAVRLSFPVDFREGAAARGGMIGDFGTNAPELWDPKRHNENGEIVGQMDLETIDAVVTMQTRVDEVGQDHLSWTDRHPLCAHWRGVPQSGVKVMAVERMIRYEDKDGQVKGHFGFVDGISNPIVTETDGENLHYAPLGSVVLGYEDDTSVPTPDLLHDGTFMVVRKMSQNVPAFSKIRRDVQERILGRRMNGDPLITAAGRNGFTYDTDPDGAVCPFTAHARRANPRLKEGVDPVTGEVTHQDSPRITRRGFSYGPRFDDDPDADRGMMFVCYNASIGEQFEVVQRWIGAGNPTGIYSGRNDALLGPAPVDEARTFRYLDDKTGKVEREDLGATPFVTLKWGMYFFVPSLSAISQIAKWATEGEAVEDATLAQAALVAKGAEIVATLTSEDHWKAVLEDGDPRMRDKSDAVAAYITAKHDGVMRVPQPRAAWAGGDGFVLVTDPDKVMGVFNDTVNFSNRVYWKRMKDVIGPVYLGMDPVPQPLSAITGNPDDKEFEERTVGVYAAETKEVNPFLGLAAMGAPPQAAVFGLALKAVRDGLASDDLPSEPDPEVRGGRRKMIDMEELIGGSVATFGLKWLGLPGDWLREAAAQTAIVKPASDDEIITIYPHLVSAGGDGAHKPTVPAPTGTPQAPDDFLEMASYFFGPWPQKDTTVRATYKGKALTERVVTWLKTRGSLGQLPPSTLIGFLQLKEPTWSDEDLVRLALNSAIGLHAPTCASFAGVAYDWLREGTFWRLQQDIVDAAEAAGGELDMASAAGILRDPIIASMARYAGPKHLHRVCTSETVTIGGEAVKGGDKVVLALGSAAQRREDLVEKEQVLFGGLYGEANQPTHACPGRNLAMTLMMATMAGLMLTGHVVRNSSLTAYVRV